MFPKKIFLFLVFLISSLNAFAQAQVYAYVDKNYVEVKEEISLVINVVSNSANIKYPVMPSLPNFNIYSSGQMRSTTMLNGNVTVKMQFNYILSPRFAGKSTIGSFAVEVDGTVYKTDPIDIEVYRSGQGSNSNTSAANQTYTYAGSKAAYQNKVKTAKNNQNQQSNNTNYNNMSSVPVSVPASTGRNKYPDFFLTANVDKKEAYLNEQINLKVRFYSNKNTIGNPSYEGPKMEGFISEDIKTGEGYETIGSSRYYYYEFDMALFGILPGVATIGSARVEYIPSAGFMDALDSFFNTVSKPQVVKSEPISITIKPLPQQGKDSNFSGAVGTNFRMSAKVDKTEVHAGETIILTTKISGIGNIRAINSLPPLDLGPSFRVFDSTSSSNIKIQSGMVGGISEFQTIIVPRTSGNFTIPATTLQYFNPKTNSYETIQSQPINIKVLPAEDNQDNKAVQDFSQADINQGGKIEKFSSDIYYLKQEESSLLNLVLTKIKELGKYNYLLFAVLALALLINFIRKGEFEFLSSQKAYLRAKKQIAKAKNINDIAPALQTYLSAKQGKPLGITTIAQSAKNLKLDSATSTLLNAFWQELEMLKYAPGDTLKNDVALKQRVQKALNLLKQIEKEAK